MVDRYDKCFQIILASIVQQSLMVNLLTYIHQNNYRINHYVVLLGLAQVDST